ncbi:MAG: acetyl-CoA decarbonylase/synthase complex subunit gamma, partial [Syntrophobacteraceae bacterium]
MGLTGIQIFKLLPKTNCGECGVPTCLAFAMNLAAGKAELEKCPYVSDESKEKLASESAPPIRPLTIGTGEYAVKIGGETVLFRHEKTFVNPPGLAVMVTTDEDNASVAGKIERFKKAQFERVGIKMRPELFAIRDTNGEAARFCALAKVISDETGAGLIFMSESIDVLTSAVDSFKDRKPLLYAATADNIEALGNLAKAAACPIAVKGDGSFESIIALTEKLSAMGLKDIVIDTGTRDLKTAFKEQVVIRRAALKDRVRALGSPTIVMANEMADD